VTTISRKDIGLRSERGPVLLSVMLSIALVAIDSTILATAVPAIVDDLGGFDQFPWIFSVYVLAQAVTMPVFGKLSDTFGRKPVMRAGVGLFLVGSLLCGLAWDMTALVVFRALQGIGAGAVQPTGQTIMSDIYSVAERAKAQGYVASVWAASSVLGPLTGGLFVDHLSWRWIFFVNLPVGLVALLLLRRLAEPTRPRERRRIDVAGTVLLTVGGVLFLLGLLEGGQSWAWASPVSLAVFGAAAVLLAAFAYVERRVAEPVLPLWVFGSRTLNAANASVLIVGVLMLSLTTYIPLYAQGVLGSSALAGGLALAALTLGWPITASNAGRLYLRVGFRATMLTGAVTAVAGAALLLTIDAGSPVWWLAVPTFVVGLGFGLIANPAIISSQSAVGRDQRGVATSANLFARSIGSAVGVAMFGAVVNGAVRDRIGAAPGGELEGLPAGVLDPALQLVFAGAAVVGVLLLLTTALMPPGRDAQAPDATAGPDQSAAGATDR